MATTDVRAASPTETEPAALEDFLIARGGPFYELQRQLGLLHERALKAGRRAAILAAVFEIDKSIALPIPAKILVCDDVLTSGAHFRAMHMVLSGRFPEARVGGLFLARTVQLNPFADEAHF